MLSWDFIVAFLSILFIDLILAGDNAVVIAMAVRGLPFAQKKKGILLGAGAAVILRIVLILCGQTSYIQLHKILRRVIAAVDSLSAFGGESP
jgi:predicted tellurium resistance membrane protein TerC